MAAVHASRLCWTSICAGPAACWCRCSYGDWLSRTRHTATRTSRGCSKAAADRLIAGAHPGRYAATSAARTCVLPPRDGHRFTRLWTPPSREGPWVRSSVRRSRGWSLVAVRHGQSPDLPGPLADRQHRGHACEMAKPLLCRVGWHTWHKRTNDAGQSYLTCGRCGKYADNGRPTTPFGADGGG